MDELTTAEVAERLGVSQRAVLYAVKRGDLTGTPIRRGKKVYWQFAESDVDAYLEAIAGQGSNESNA